MREILKLLVENVSRTGSPIPVPAEAVYGWAKPLGLPRGRATALYTGALYQLTPYINSLVRLLERLEESPAGTAALRLARVAGRVVDLSRFTPKPERGEVEWAEGVLRSIARLLTAAGVDYGYVYERDLYSGVLLYDLGLDEAFARHASRVYRELKAEGVRRVVTVDPHTTHVLREAYPRYVDGFDLEVVNYLELLAERGIQPKAGGPGGEWVIHDPCFYARHLGILEQPRRLLGMAGFKVVEPRRSRRMTYCCGGPLESISPALSRRIAETRMRELAGHGGRIVTLCPICYANLGRVKPEGVEVRDIAELLASRLS